MKQRDGNRASTVSWGLIALVGVLGLAAGYAFSLLGNWPWNWPHDALHLTIADTLRNIGRIVIMATTFAVIIMILSRSYLLRR